MDGTTPSVLVVSEDPEFLVSAREVLAAAGVRMTGCLGPAQSSCLLDTDGRCSLADRARVAIVDAPPSGSFERHTRSIQAGTYAERLAETKRDGVVVLVGVAEGSAGGCGDVVHARTRQEALDLIGLTWSSSTDGVPTDGKEIRREGAGR